MIKFSRTYIETINAFHTSIKSIFKKSIGLSALERCPAGYATIQFPQDKNATNLFVIALF